MTGISQATISSKQKQISFHYKLGILFIMLFFTIGLFLSLHLVSSKELDASQLEYAHRKQTLVQRISFLKLSLMQIEPAQRPRILESLNQNLANLEQVHDTLLSGDPRNERKRTLPENLEALYFKRPVEQDKKIKHFLHFMRNAKINGEHQQMAGMISKMDDELEESIAAEINLYENQVDASIANIYNTITAFIMLSSAFLLIMFAAVLRPALRYINQAQGQISELNQLKGNFLANISHEIRTPMNGIFGMTELLLETGIDQRQQHYVRTLQTSADHLLGLINDILDYSKLEAGQMQLDPTRFNLHATIEDTLELMAPKAREKKLELLLRYLPGTPRLITADAGRIRQILFNLVGNAIKFTDNGYVLVHVEILQRERSPDNRQWLRVRVEDSGIGIPENKIGLLFEKFMQVESGSNRARQGTGLGLAISRNLVQLMGGKIEVSSVAGKGSTFTWQIPLIACAEAERPEETNKKLSGRRVLFVDDLAPNRTLYSEILAEAGMECIVAENAKEALTRLTYEYENNKPIDILITDYVMPGEDGLILTNAVKANPVLRATPVIILSSVGEQGLVRQFAESGASACLAKPVTRQQLYDTISHVLETPKAGHSPGLITLEAAHSLSVHRLLEREKPLYGTHILLAEDNRVNREITTEMMENFGCRVTTAENGEEAVLAAAKEDFDLIFMDCQMPVMDGFEATRHITALKTEGKIKPVPIIALTANAMKGDRERCIENGMDDYVSKPLRKANMEAILLKWLRSRLENPVEVYVPPAANSNQPPVISKSADNSGIDMEAFNQSREIMGQKLATIISYFLEDSENYLARIEAAISENDPAAAVMPAHTLKSSSRQFGIMRLSEFAKRTEEACRQQTGGKTTEEIAPLVKIMREALNSARPFLTEVQKSA